MFHKHIWKEIIKTYQQSELESARENGLTELYQLGNFHIGYTMILWECSICKKQRKQTLKGREIKP